MICGFPLAFRIWTFLERVVDGLVSHVAPRGWCKVQMAVHHLHQGAGDHRAFWGRGALSLTYRSVGPRGPKLAGEMAHARVADFQQAELGFSMISQIRPSLSPRFLPTAA